MKSILSKHHANLNSMHITSNGAINRTRYATHIIPRLAGLLGHPKKRTTGKWRERDAFHDIIQGVQVREVAVGTSADEEVLAAIWYNSILAGRGKSKNEKEMGVGLSGD